MLRASRQLLRSRGAGVRNNTHYLYVYDGLKSVFGDNCQIEANITNKHKYQAHMTCLLPFEPGSPEFDTQALAAKIQPALSRLALSPFAGRLELDFPDDVFLYLTFGPECASIEMLNRTDNEADRALLRGSFGCDMDLFHLNIDLQVKTASAECFEWAKTQFAPEAVPPLLFWEALCYRCQQEMGILEMHRLCSAVTENFWYVFPRPTNNPALPEEDLNGYAEIDRCLSIYDMTRERPCEI